jgi:hypothetical protein
VFGADFPLAHAFRFLMSQAEDTARALGKTIQTFRHVKLPLRPKNRANGRRYHSTKFRYADYKRESAFLLFFQVFLID